MTSTATPENLFHTLCAALTEICCPTMARARVRNGSPRGTRWTRGWRRMIAAITGSRRASARLALSQYSGFIEGKIQEEVLRFHSDHVVLVRGERQVDRPAGDVAPHLAGFGEFQAE